MSEQVRLRRGHHIRVRLMDTDDEWCNGFVGIASDTNPSSVMVLTQGAVRTSNGGMIVGAIPLSIDYEAGKVTSLLGDEYEIEVAG